MSRYEVNSLLYRLKKDPEFRARFDTDPRAALADADLTEAERRLLVEALEGMGGGDRSGPGR